MAKLTTQSFIDDHLGGASQYDEPNLRSMLDAYVSHATDSLDYELTAAEFFVSQCWMCVVRASTTGWRQILCGFRFRAQQGEGEVCRRRLGQCDQRY